MRDFWPKSEELLPIVVKHLFLSPLMTRSTNARPKPKKQVTIQTDDEYQPTGMSDADIPMSQQSITSSDAGCAQPSSRVFCLVHCSYFFVWGGYKDNSSRRAADARFAASQWLWMECLLITILHIVSKEKKDKEQARKFLNAANRELRICVRFPNLLYAAIL